MRINARLFSRHFPLPPLVARPRNIRENLISCWRAREGWRGFRRVLRSAQAEKRDTVSSRVGGRTLLISDKFSRTVGSGSCKGGRRHAAPAFSGSVVAAPHQNFARTSLRASGIFQFDGSPTSHGIYAPLVAILLPVFLGRLLFRAVCQTPSERSALPPTAGVT